MKQSNSSFETPYKALRHTPLFKDVKEEILKTIIKDCEHIEWKKGESIDSNITNRYLFILISGKVKITQINPQN